MKMSEENKQVLLGASVTVVVYATYKTLRYRRIKKANQRKVEHLQGVIKEMDRFITDLKFRRIINENYE